MLNGFNLYHHVSEATHKNGNTLDLLITRSGDNFISDVHIIRFNQPHADRSLCYSLTSEAKKSLLLNGRRLPTENLGQ